jgi:hypothetical protein
VLVQLFGLLLPGPITIFDEIFEILLYRDQFGVSRVSPLKMGVDKDSIVTDHLANERNRILTALDFQGMQAQINVVFQFLALNGKGYIGVTADFFIDSIDFFVAFAFAPHQLFSLGFSQQAETVAAPTLVRTTLIFNDFVAVLIRIHLFDIRITGYFVEQAVPDTADATVAMDEYFG